MAATICPYSGVPTTGHSSSMNAIGHEQVHKGIRLPARVRKTSNLAGVKNQDKLRPLQPSTATLKSAAESTEARPYGTPSDTKQLRRNARDVLAGETITALCIRKRNDYPASLLGQPNRAGCYRTSSTPYRFQTSGRSGWSLSRPVSVASSLVMPQSMAAATRTEARARGGGSHRFRHMTRQHDPVAIRNRRPQDGRDPVARKLNHRQRISGLPFRDPLPPRLPSRRKR